MSNNINVKLNNYTEDAAKRSTDAAEHLYPLHEEYKRDNSSCAHVPEFRRLNYFYGQLLGAHDFQIEQNFFREKMKLHNRCLHGYGVVCGLRVTPEPLPISCEPETYIELASLKQELKALEAKIEEAEKSGSGGDELKQLFAYREKLQRRLDEIAKENCEDEVPTRIHVECGLALDCDGNELVVRRPITVDLWKALSRDDRLALEAGEHSLYVSICYCEQPVDPVRPVLADACGATPECVYGKLRDAVRIEVSTVEPDSDERCETCCAPCREYEADSCQAEAAPCLLLARIDNFTRGKPVAPGDIYNEVRRGVSLYEPTTITGISWTHGAVYTGDEADQVLGQMEIRFSREVRVSTITEGVIDMWVVEGGETRGAGIYSLELKYVDLPAPPQKFTKTLKFRYEGDETLDPGDRVLIFIRAGFILDKCCRPVDGTNTGGRTPLIDEEVYRRYARQREATQECVSPPPGFGPWTSGIGSSGGGGTFESWFYISPSKQGGYKKARTVEES